MRLSKREQKLVDLVQQVSAAPPHGVEKPSLYQLVRDYPGRCVSANTAYVRLLRKINVMGLHKTCTTPPKSSGRANLPVECAKNPQFIAALKSDRGTQDIAAEWGIHRTTVTKYRRDIKEGLLNARTLP